MSRITKSYLETEKLIKFKSSQNVNNDVEYVDTFVEIAVFQHNALARS